MCMFLAAAEAKTFLVFEYKAVFSFLLFRALGLVRWQNRLSEHELLFAEGDE
jgi:hypothetical protein